MLVACRLIRLGVARVWQRTLMVPEVLAMPDSHFGLVVAPPYVGWLPDGRKGWMAQLSGSNPAAVRQELQRRYGMGAPIVVLPMGERPDDRDDPRLIGA